MLMTEQELFCTQVYKYAFSLIVEFQKQKRAGRIFLLFERGFTHITHTGGPL